MKKLNNNKTLSIIWVLVLQIIFLYKAPGQPLNDLYEKGLGLRKSRDYRNGLVVFQQLLKSDSNNVNYLVQGSFFYTKCGFYLDDNRQKLLYYQVSRRYAQRAIKGDANNADAHYVYALVLGHMSALGDIQEKIENAAIVKGEIETALKLNNKLAGAYHMLGRWHSVVAGFNCIQKVAINTFFNDAAKGATYDYAISCFLQAISLEPFYKMHMVALAETYYEMGLASNCRYWLERARQVPSRGEDDKYADKKCVELLKKLN